MREEYFAAFRDGITRVISNVGVLCLDDQTEILTRRGWVGIDDMAVECEVAGWSMDGRIRWERPSAVHRRFRLADERMVSIGGRISVRVTEGHGMVHSKGADHGWSKSPAIELVGRAVRLPVCGIAAPDTFSPAEPSPSVDQMKIFRRHTRCNLRKLEHWPEEDVESEITRRWNRKLSLRQKSPGGLTHDECSFIGFWLGDGSGCKRALNGSQYRISESARNRDIIDWVDGLIARMGLDAAISSKGAPGCVPRKQWSFGRGTGSGSQSRNGVYAFERFLDKSGSDLLWGLSREQLLHLLHGLWLADGDHGEGGQLPEYFGIHCAHKPLLDKLQAVCVCRGMTARVRRRAVSQASKSKGFRDMWYLSIHTTKTAFFIGKERMLLEHALNDGERVWCVTVPSGNIVTRRNGLVCVTGNCEGWDAPHASVIALLNPTTSRSKICQMIGRGTRLYEGKESTLVIDFCPGRMKKGRLASPADALAGEMLPDNVHEHIATEGDLAECIKKAEKTAKDIEDSKVAAESKARAQAAETLRLRDEVRAKKFVYGIEDHDMHAMFGARGDIAAKLEKRGVNVPQVDAERRARGLCSVRQAAVLARAKLNPDLPWKLARTAIDAMAANGWVVPESIASDKRYYR